MNLEAQVLSEEQSTHQEQASNNSPLGTSAMPQATPEDALMYTRQPGTSVEPEVAPAVDPEVERARIQQLQEERQQLANDVREWSEQEGVKQAQRATGTSTEGRQSLEAFLRERGHLDEYQRHNDAGFRDQLDDIASRSRQQGIDSWQEANETAQTLYNAMWGWGTDERAIHTALEGKSPQQIALIKEAYQDRYEVSLEERINEEMSGSDLQYANELMSGSEQDAQAAKLYWAIKGAGTDEDMVHQVLAREDAAEIERIFNEKYASQYGAADLREALATDMGGRDLARAEALLDAAHADQSDGPDALEARARADAIELNQAMKGGIIGWDGTDEDAIYEILGRNQTPEQLDAIKRAYQAEYDVSLQEHLDDEMSGYLEARAMRLLEGDTVGADVAALQYAMHGGTGIGYDREGIRTLLEGKDEDYLEKLQERYLTEQKVSLEDDLKSEMGEDSGAFAMYRELSQTGSASEAARIAEAIEGLGTDEDQIREALKGKTKAEIEGIRAAYLELTDRELDSDIWYDLGGDDFFDVTEAMRGTPETPQEAYDALKRRHEHETSGIMSWAVDPFTAEDEIMERQLALAEERMARITHGTETQEDRESMIILQKHHGIAADGFREARNSVADTAAMVGTVVVATGTIIATGGTATGFWIAVGAAALTRTGIKYGIKGNGYSSTEFAQDVGMAVVEAGTARLGMAITKGLDKVRYLATLSKGGLRAQMFRGAVDGAADGALSGVLSGAGEAAIMKDHESLSDFFENVAQGAAIGGVGGGVGGGVLSPAFVAGGHGFSRLYRTVRGAPPAELAASRVIDDFVAEAGDGVRVSGNGKAVYVDDPDAIKQLYARQRAAELLEANPQLGVDELADIVDREASGIVAFYDPAADRMILPSIRDAADKETRLITTSFAAHEAAHARGLGEVDAWMVQAEYLHRNGMTMDLSNGSPVFRKMTNADDRLTREQVESFVETVYAQRSTRLAAATTDPIQQEAREAIDSLTEGMVKGADIEEFLERFPVDQREEALAVLSRLGRDGNIDHLNALRSFLDRADNPAIFSTGDGSFADTLSYLANQKDSFMETLRRGDRGYVDTITDIDSIDSSTIIILDESMVQRLETDVAFRNKVITSNARLVQPSAAFGRDPLGGVALGDELAEDINRVLAASRDYDIPLDSPDSVDELIDVALNTDLQSRMTAIDVTNKIERLPAGELTGDVDELARYMNRGVDMDEDRLLSAISDRFPDLSEKKQRLLLQYVKASGDVYTPASMNQRLIEQHDAILAFAQRKGIDESDIVYVVPNADKSYSAVAAMYKRANPGSANQFISAEDFASRAAALEADGKMVVVLDDVAGSGKSLDEVRAMIRERGFDGPLAISPVIASQDAMDGSVVISNYDFPGFQARMDADPNFAMLPGSVRPSLADTDFYRSLPANKQQELLRLLKNRGYGDQGLLVVMPYMAPNNNAQGISQVVGEQFTLNGRGVKGF